MNIRRATLMDIEGICHVNRGEAGPWAELESCRAWVFNRMNQGFEVQVAVADGQIVGHAEWLLSDEHRWRTFYLGQLMVDVDWQGRGVGRRMVEAGIAMAREQNCDSVSLIPELDTHSEIFYAKCGFVRGRDLLRCELPSLAGDVMGERAQEAPFEVIQRLPFLFGLSQTAAHHMWQVINRPPKGYENRVDTLVGTDFCLQLRGFAHREAASLLAWGDPSDASRMLQTARAFAHQLGYPAIALTFFPELRPIVGAGDFDSFEMYMPLENQRTKRGI